MERELWWWRWEAMKLGDVIKEYHDFETVRNFIRVLGGSRLRIEVRRSLGR